jgi:hypothetical protein
VNKRFWCSCPNPECNAGEWVSEFSSEYGMLFAADAYGEECTECGSEVIVGDEYEQGDCQ